MTQIDRFYGLAGDAAVKLPCRVRTTAAITLSGEQTIDSVAIVAGNRVLVMNQTDDTTNGIYICATGAWTRAADFDGPRDVLSGTLVIIAVGTLYAGYVYRISTLDDITIGTSSINFTNALIASDVASATSLSDAITAPADADLMPVIVGGVLKKSTWANLKLTIGSWLQARTATAFTTGGTSTVFTLAVTPTITANVENMEFDVEFNAASGATPTLTVGTGAAAALKYRDSTGALQAVTSTQVPSGWRSKVVFDGTYWIVREVPPVVYTTVSAASQAEQETGTSTSVYVSPGRQHFHPSAIKAWGKAGVTGNLLAGYNITSVTDVGTGRVSFAYTTQFASSDNAAVVSVEHNAPLVCVRTSASASTVGIDAFNMSSAATDPTSYSAICAGDFT